MSFLFSCFTMFNNSFMCWLDYSSYSLSNILLRSVTKKLHVFTFVVWNKILYFLYKHFLSHFHSDTETLLMVTVHPDVNHTWTPPCFHKSLSCSHLLQYHVYITTADHTVALCAGHQAQDHTHGPTYVHIHNIDNTVHETSA